MPNINDFLKDTPKTDSKKNDWDLSSMISNSKASTRPQRRPGRGEDAPNIPPVSTTSLGEPIPPSLTDQELVTDGKADTNRQQTGNKLATNRQQTGNKLDTQPATNRQQTGNKLENKEEVQKETGNKVGTQPATLSATKWQQSGNKPATKPIFSSLVGLQRSAMIFLYDACKTARGRSTEALTLEHMGLCLKTSPGSVKTTVQRLEAREYVLRISFKNGRGGWSKYELPESLFREMLQLETENKLATNWQQTGNKVGTQPATEPATSPPSSSSINVLEDLRTTTTAETKIVRNTTNQLGREWLEIDYSVLSEIHFGPSQLSQIAQVGKLKPNEVQDSINAFAFDLKKNQKEKDLKSSPLNFFMGILRKGISYTPPENYESPEDEAFRKCLESKRAQLARRQAMEQEMVGLEFQEWRATLTREQRLKYAPEAKVDESEVQKGYLQNYFEKHVYSKFSDNSQKQTSGIGQWVSTGLQQKEPTEEEIRVIADAQFGSRG